ncbi:CheR family methyltransferase [Aliikangiella sp. IMCC44632]
MTNNKNNDKLTIKEENARSHGIAKAVVNNMASKKATHIVGIGASAGGLEPLKSLVKNLPNNLGIAYIIVQHLSPDFKTYMGDLLAPLTSMPVVLPADLEPIQADHIYCIPERKNLTVADDKVILSDIEGSGVHHPIDVLFKSLTEEKQNNSIGIVLSGTGSDGAQGVEFIGASSGLTIVQDPSTAEFDSMPLNAINTNAVDIIIEVEKIGEYLKNYIANQLNINPNKSFEESNDILTSLFELISAEQNIDLGDYKPSTLERRITHRMGVNSIENLSEYYDYLKREPGEQSLLVKDLLIGVTEFFREESYWDTLVEEHLKPLLLNSVNGKGLRFWSVGCSTGEEVYSLAIALCEALDELNIEVPFKVFASDLDAKAIHKASLGHYRPSSLEKLPKALVNKYFIVGDGEYKVTDKLRNCVVFATHNILTDPPFSNIDLVVCRNLLIYFQMSAQKRVLARFHFALRENGLLFLGASENVNVLNDVFNNVDSRIHLYRKVGDKRLPLEAIKIPTTNAEFLRKNNSEIQTPPVKKKQVLGYMKSFQDFLFSKFVPPTLVINELEEVIYSFGNTETFTEKPKPGKHSLHYSAFLEAGISTIVKSILSRLSEETSHLLITDIQLGDGDLVFSIDAHYKSFGINSDEIHYFISFSKPILMPLRGLSTDSQKSQNSKLSYRIEQLDAELVDARVLIGEKQKDIDVMTEELQANNEELVTSNEELQSSNEELHSVNEELFTVNLELKEKVEELESSQRDLNSILNISEMGVVYLDDSLLIRRFTKNAKKYINLLPLDIGRPFTDMTTRFDCAELYQWIDQVKNEFRAITKTVSSVDKNDPPVKISINPSFDDKDVFCGIILTFVAAASKTKES